MPGRDTLRFDIYTEVHEHGLIRLADTIQNRSAECAGAWVAMPSRDTRRQCQHSVQKRGLTCVAERVQDTSA